MRWAEIREQYPNQWLIVDALEAHTEGDRRKLDQMTVVEVCSDGAAALSRYQELHRQHPQREFYFVHTAREELDIRERYWLGLRRRYATHPTGTARRHGCTTIILETTHAQGLYLKRGFSVVRERQERGVDLSVMRLELDSRSSGR